MLEEIVTLCGYKESYSIITVILESISYILINSCKSTIVWNEASFQGYELTKASELGVVMRVN